MIRIALAQLNPTVGDLQGNVALIRDAIRRAKDLAVDLIAFPELVITGYPADDLLLNKTFILDAESALIDLARSTHGITTIIGCPQGRGAELYNAAAIASQGVIRGAYRKHHLPNYGVFDERRFFKRGEGILLGRLGGVTFGVTICEDLWESRGPYAACAAAGASIVININASPYHAGKGRERRELLSRRAAEGTTGLAYVNAVGGNDELVFDGQSMVVDAKGELIARAKQFEPDLLVFDWEQEWGQNEAGQAQTPPDTGQAPAEPVRIIELGPGSPQTKPSMETVVAEELPQDAEIYQALVLGVRDYLGKNGFKQALVGISGGIDSALTAAIASDALGAGNVLGVSNPSEFTSQESIDGAEELARNLGIELVTLPIDDPFQNMLKTLDPILGGGPAGITEQNLQARIRGMLWMAISNKTGRLVLSTGNKSELATGYATLYGDMAGGFAVLKDVSKTRVYRLSFYRNSVSRVIPQSIINRPPTAELARGQLDTDSLPPYAVLDPILEAYLEQGASIDEIAKKGVNRKLIRDVIKMVDRAEYKRRQAPPGIKITPRAFGRDRRVPITNRYRSSAGLS
jgi:NAD+ synthase (glutamine-hydrolysing)